METEVKNQVNELGKKIKALIVQKGLRVMDVAHDANLDPNNLRKYLRGSQEMRVTTLLRIATALDVPAGELLEGLQTKKKTKSSS